MKKRFRKSQWLLTLDLPQVMNQLGFLMGQDESILTQFFLNKTIEALGWSGSSLNRQIYPNFITRVIMLLLI